MSFGFAADCIKYFLGWLKYTFFYLPRPISILGVLCFLTDYVFCMGYVHGVGLHLHFVPLEACKHSF